MSERYIVLPAGGVRGSVPIPEVGRLEPVPGASPKDKRRRLTTPERAGAGGPPAMRRVSRPVRVLDELPGSDGAKLVELDPSALAEARAAAPAGTRIVREQTYRPAVAGTSMPDPAPNPTGATISVEVRRAGTQAPLAGATVTAIVDEEQHLGASATTGPDGRAALAIAAGTVERLSVRPPRTGSWGACARQVRVADGFAIELQPLDLALPDVLRHFYAKSAAGSDGAGVRVGVIDTGIDAGHPDLAVAVGVNTVVGEPDDLHGDNGLGHGTHVAGIVAARGTAPDGVRGLAPEADLVSLRVYASGEDTAGGYAIVKALVNAQVLECDVVNLSLEAPADDESIQDAIADAHAHGMVVIGAAGNGGRAPVASPARYASAVTALGRRGTYPAGSLEEDQVAEPCGSSPEDFLAGFSNHGREVDFIAPGLGVVSTVPGGHSPDQGTSMAAAAATGMAARILSANPATLALPRDDARTSAMQRLLAAHARSMGLGFAAEGNGML